MPETKQANFRITQKDADDFRALCSSLGLSQGQGFSHIMRIAEIDRAKQKVPDRAAEIERFEMHVKALTEAYLYSLEACGEAQDIAAERIGDRLKEQETVIDSLKGTIGDLKSQLRAKDADVSLARETALRSSNAAAAAQKEAKSLEKLAEEKDRSCSLFKDRAEKAEKELEEMRKELEKAGDLQRRLDDAVQKAAAAEAQAAFMQKENARLDGERREAVSRAETLIREKAEADVAVRQAKESAEAARRERDSLDGQLKDLISEREKFTLDMAQERERAEKELKKENGQLRTRIELLEAMLEKYEGGN